MSDKKKMIPNIAAALQVAFYASYLVPDYNNLTLEARTKKVEEDYFMVLKIADVIVVPVEKVLLTLKSKAA